MTLAFPRRSRLLLSCDRLKRPLTLFFLVKDGGSTPTSSCSVGERYRLFSRATPLARSLVQSVRVLSRINLHVDAEYTLRVVGRARVACGTENGSR